MKNDAYEIVAHDGRRASNGSDTAGDQESIYDAVPKEF